MPPPLSMGLAKRLSKAKKPIFFKNLYSVEFDGVNDYVDCGTGLGNALGDNYAGSLTVSLWFKADVTSGDDGMFEIGPFAGAYGEINVSLASNHLRFKLNGGGWTRTAAFTDTASWHHIVCVYSAGNEANSKVYLDGVDQTALGTEGTFPSSGNMDFAGLKTIIGAYVSATYPFNGNINGVAVWNSALSAAQITAIYNKGKPRNLLSMHSISPVSWWQMGDGTLDDGSKRLIGDQANLTLGSELVTNGNFSDNSVPDTWNGSSAVNLVGWTSGGATFTANAHFVITDGKCRLISDGTNAVINSGTVVVGKTYQYSIDVTNVATGGLTLIGGGHVLEANITSTGTYTGVFTATATTAISINRNAGGGGVADFTFDNVSVKEFNGYVGRMKNMDAADIVTDTP